MIDEAYCSVNLILMHTVVLLNTLKRVFIRYKK